MQKYRVPRYRPSQRVSRREMRQYRKKKSGTRRLVSALALVLMVVGLGMLGYVLLGQDSPLQKAVETATGDEEAPLVPTDTTLKLTVPKMSRVEDLPVYTRPWDDESALDQSALHPDDTGFPWQDGSNVYIAGHRMGWPGTSSFLVFYDLDKLEDGDEVDLTDAQGTKYTYTVFKETVLEPTDYYTATDPVPGKSVVTLQTCTLPDYTQRLIVQAEMTNVEKDGSSQETTAPPSEVPLEAA